MPGSSFRFRFIIIFLVVGFCIHSLLPNFIEAESPLLPKKKIVLGLDIQGGLHLVMEAKIEDVLKEQNTRDALSMADYFKRQGIDDALASPIEENNSYAIEITSLDSTRIGELLNENWPSYLIVESSLNRLVIKQSEVSIRDFRDRIVGQSIETLRNRIDAFGVTEPSITSQGQNRILIQIPGLQESDYNRAKDLISKTARLDFMLVSDETQDLSRWIEDAETAGGYDINSIGGYTKYIDRLNEDIRDKLTQNQVLLFQKPENVTDIEVGRIPYLLERTDVGGDDLRDAFVSIGEMNQPEVSINFNPDGARQFAKLTGDNINRQLAIVLDNTIYSAPNIQSRIPNGRGRITLGGGGTYESIMSEARTISMALRAGALPARLEQLEERTVGPTLGRDSIEKSKKAILVGGLLVLLFMLFYYKGFGLVSNITLGLNMVLIMGVLTSLEATLTLPGVAGIALTIGMAVDANVIIFERIKEELAKKVGFAASVETGFKKGLSAIFDSNITTAATSVILMYFGTGPVRGFAVTLLIGIATSLFTAVFVTKVILDYQIHKRGKTIPI